MRTDQFHVTAVVDGRNLGTWDTQGGGSGGAEESKHRPGGMGAEVSLGGRQTRDNVVLTRLFSVERGDDELLAWLDSRRGRGLATVTSQPLDVDGNPSGKPRIFTGRVGPVTHPDHDSNGSDAAMWGFEVSTVGDVG